MLATGVLVLLALAAWLRGGTVVRFQPYLLMAGFLVLVLLIVSVVGTDFRLMGQRARRHGTPLIRDPALWVGLFFLGVLAAQGWNAGQYQFFHPFRREWVYSGPRHPGWPSAVKADDVLEMFRWFVPAIILLVTLRSSLIRPTHRRWILRGLLANGALLALVGILQRATGRFTFLGLDTVKAYYFSAFGYANHAGSYFLLMTALGAGLVVHEIRRQARRGRWPTGLLWLLPATILCFTGANLSLSRAAIILVWLLLAALLVWNFVYFWSRLRAAQRLNLVAGLLGVTMLLGMGILAAARSDIGREMQTITRDKHNRQITPTQSLSHEMRLALLGAAWQMWQDRPWYGVGAWGFRYRLYEYLPADQKHLARATGRANTHNDTLQFLAEFGLVGFIPLLTLAGLAVAPGVRTGIWRDPAAGALWLGSVLVVGHSMIDLPFRSPAVMYAWLTVIALAPALIPVASKEPHYA